MAIEDDIRGVLDQLRSASSIMTTEAQQVAEQLQLVLLPSLRLALQNVLSESAANLNGQLEGTAEVSLELQDGQPQLAARVVEAVPSSPDSGQPDPGPDWDAAATRFTLRIPKPLKERAESAARQAGVSLNTWVVQAIHAALNPPTTRSSRTLRGWLA